MVVYLLNSNKVRTEVEESPLLEAVTRERQVKAKRLKRLTVCCCDLQSVEICVGTIIKCSHQSCAKVVNNSDLQPKPRL
jgi:hypothetical protein